MWNRILKWYNSRHKNQNQHSSDMKKFLIVGLGNIGEKYAIHGIILVLK